MPIPDTDAARPTAAPPIARGAVVPAPRAVHPLAYAYLTALYAMEATAHARLTQRLLAIPADADLSAYWVDEDEEGGSSRPRYRPEGSEKPRKPYAIAAGVAVVPLVGLLQKREDWLTRYYPEEATAMSTFAQHVALADADPDVTAILLYVDSPGGVVDGVDEAAQAVYAVRQAGKKRVVAAVAGTCCSAALWIAAQAQQVFCGETDWVGSIGTRLRLIDSSALYAEMGLEAVEIVTGTYKAAGAPGTVIDQQTRDYFQTLADRCQDRFTAAVARGRKKPVDDVRALAREARIYTGRDAIAAGLVDEIATPRQVFARLTKRGSGSSGATSAAAVTSGSNDQEQNDMGFREEVAALVNKWGGNGEETGGAPPATAAAAVPPQPQAQAGPALNAALVAAIVAAGVTTAEQFNGLKADADAFGAQVKAKREAAKGLVTALHAGDEALRDAEHATIDALPAGPALERYCARIAAEHDAKFGTSADAPAERQTRPNRLPSFAADAHAAASGGDKRAEVEKELDADMERLFPVTGKNGSKGGK